MTNQEVDLVAANPQAEVDGFDPDFYLRAYPDVLAAGVEPVNHYCSTGWREGRDPSSEFDTMFYRMCVSGVTDPDLCPLIHYNATGSSAGAPRNRAEARARRGYTPDAIALILALPELETHFDAALYLDRYPGAVLSGITPLVHYLTIGWREGLNPSAEFDTVFYRERYQFNDASDISPLVHFLRYGKQVGLPTNPRAARAARVAYLSDPAPDSWIRQLQIIDKETTAVLVAPHFDHDHYLRIYSDVRDSRTPPLLHFVVNGWREGRNPSPLFETDWYAKNYIGGDLVQINPLFHYAVFGRIAGHVSSPAARLRQLEQAADSSFADNLRRLVGQFGYDIGLLDLDRVRRFVLPLFCANTYRAAHGLDSSVSDVEAFLRYLCFDFPIGRPPGPIFAAEHYLSEVRTRGMAPPRPDDPPFHHWLRHGIAAGLSPNPGYVGADYVMLNQDLARYPDTLFAHFVLHGQFEGRQFNKIALVAPARPSTARADAVTRARHFCETVAASGSEDGNFAQMRDFLTSGRLERTISEAAALEPDVGSLEANLPSFLPPWHDPYWPDYVRILRAIPEGRFDAIVLMPFCKLGGSDFVAGVLSNALSESGRVLVIRTDADDWARPDWFSGDVTSVDLSTHFAALDAKIRAEVLYKLIVRFRPAAVYNVNSRLAFDTFVQFGERLAMITRLNAYYFCADRTPEGIEAGYPVRYFSNILPHLSAAMIDNATLAGQLIARYSLSGAYRDRVRLIYTPAMSAPPERTVAEQQLAQAGRRSRKRVLWAGRLDAQKRFDLVIAIARLLPEVDFDCWGKAVLDAPPDLESLPANLTLHPPFAAYSDLPLAQSDGWLYTSAWDGLPTILIELAAHGVPIVATAVGGVPELVDEETGWPMSEDAAPATYAAAIREMVDAPEERLRRGKALQERARSQHGRDRYRAALAAIAAQTR